MFKGRNFVSQREKMVREQLLFRGITDRRVLKVMREIPREEFVPQESKDQAYEDYPLPIGRGQTISQPYIVSLMTELLELKGKEKVLEVGTGSGYQAAILSRLVKKVYTLERDPVLAKQARQVLKKLKFHNVAVKVGDGFFGYPKAAPYEAIILTAAPGKIPPALIEQLAEGGKLVVPLGTTFGQRLVRIKKIKGKLEEEDFGGVAFVSMTKGIENSK